MWLLIKVTSFKVDRVSSVGIATRYGLDGPGIESLWGQRFSALVQTGHGAQPTPCKMGTASGVKRSVALTTNPYLG